MQKEQTVIPKFNGRLIRNKTVKCSICGRCPSSTHGDVEYNWRYYLGEFRCACIPCAKEQGLIPKDYEITTLYSKELSKI